MKKVSNAILSLTLVLSFVVVCADAAVSQTAGEMAGRIRLDSLDRLSARAVENVHVQVDEALLGFGASLLSANDPDEKKVKELASGLRGIYVRVLEFKGEGEYADSDVAPIREQLRAPGWTRIAGVSSRKEGFRNAEFYLARGAGGRVDGLAVLSVGPKQIVVVNLVGSIDLEKLKKLEGSFGIPRVGTDGGRAKEERR